MSVALDLSLSPEEMFYKLLTDSTPKIPEGLALSSVDLTVSALTVVTGRPDNHNTTVLLTPLPASTLVYGDPKTVAYTRKDFSAAIVANGMSLAVTDDLQNWTASTAPVTVLALLNAGFSSFLTSEDLIVSNPVTNGDGTVSCTVSIASGYLTLVGTTTFVVTATESRANSEDIPDSLDGLS